MGRAKLNMELIKKEKVRNSTFQTRKACLKKKVYELSTLCGIKASVIIYGPKQVTMHDRPLEPEIFPDNRDQVLELINKYKVQPPEERKKRTTLLSDFFTERNKKAEQVLDNLRTANVKSKYPPWDSRFSSYNEEQLRGIATMLEKNITKAKADLERKANNNSKKICSATYLQHAQLGMLTNKRSMDFEEENIQANKYLTANNPQHAGPMRVPIPMPMPVPQQRVPFMDHYHNQRMVQFGNDYVGGASNMVYNAPLYNYQMMADTYVNNFARAPPYYYGEGMQPIPPHLMDYYSTREVGSTSQQMGGTSHQANDHAQYYEDCKWQR